MQYPQVTCDEYPEVQTISRMGILTPRQQMLREIKDRLCGGNAAELARRIGKDPTYINRLFYEKSKSGHKGIGLEIMDVCSREFFLPKGFWDRSAQGDEPYLEEWEVARSLTLRDLRNQAYHGADPAALGRFQKALTEFDLESRWGAWGRASEDAEIPMFSRGPAREPAPSYGLQPILSWQHEEELPPGEFVMVPRLDVHLSAGHGNGTSQVEIQFNEAQPQAFRADWIRQQHFKPKRLAAMTANGDSMEPTIHDGDSLLIDTAQTEVQDGKVYALWYDGGERVKRLFRLPGGGLRIESDNTRYRGIELGPEYAGHVRVIGRVVHRSGTGGL